MRPPWLQIETDFVEVVAQDLAVLLEISEAAAGWGVQKMFIWALARCPPEQPPSANDVIRGSGAARLLAHAAGYTGDPETFVAACEEVRPALLERVDGGIRVRGLRRYDATWEKNQRRTNRSGTGAEPERNRSGTGPQDPDPDPDPKEEDPPPPTPGEQPVMVVVEKAHTDALWARFQELRAAATSAEPPEPRRPKGFSEWHRAARAAGKDDDQLGEGYAVYLEDGSIRAKGHPTAVFMHPEVWPLRIPPRRARPAPESVLPIGAPPVEPAAAAAWAGVLGDLRDAGKPYAAELLDAPHVVPERLDDTSLTLWVPSSEGAEWIRTTYGALLERFTGLRGLDVRLVAPGPAPPLRLMTLERQEDERHRTSAEVLQLVRDAVGGT